IMGSEQPRKSDLSRRRSIRRLLLANCRRMMVFTRNSSGVVVGNEVVLLPRLRKTPEDFEFFHASAGRDRREYAFLRTSLRTASCRVQTERFACPVEPTLCSSRPAARSGPRTRCAAVPRSLRGFG